MKAFFFLIITYTISLLASDYIEVSDQIMQEYRLEMLLEHGLVSSGSGGGYINNLNQIFQGFQSEKQLTLDEARKLFVEVSLKLLNAINNNHNLRPFLSNYPFTFNDIKVKISFCDSEEQVTSPYVSYISGLNGTIFYNTIDPKINTSKYQLLHSETFEDACILAQKD